MAFQKGNNANPNGGRRPRMVTQQIVAALNEATDQGPSKLRALVDKLITLALGGDMQAINAVMDRVEGKPIAMVTSDEEAFRRATELSDDELAGSIDSIRSLIAGGGRGTANGAATSKNGSGKPH